MRALLLAAALVATPLAAQAPVAPDATTLAAARDLMTATDIQGQMKALMPRMAEAAGTQLRQMFADNKMPDGLQQQMTAAIQANMASMQDVMTPQVIDQMAMVYARHFSVDELKRLTVLMRDPVMTRYRAEMPNMMGEIMPIMFEAMKPQQQVFQAKMRQIIADWIKQHPEDKAKLRSPTAS
jgi:uncharacterized protein